MMSALRGDEGLVDRLCGMRTKGAMEGGPKCRPFCRRNSWMAPYHASTSGTARLERKRPSCFRSSDAALSANAVAPSFLAKMSDCCAKWERKETLLDGTIIRIVDRFETRALDPRAKRVTDRRTGNGLSSVPSIKGSSIQSNSHSGRTPRDQHGSNFEVVCLH